LWLPQHDTLQMAGLRFNVAAWFDGCMLTQEWVNSEADWATIVHINACAITPDMNLPHAEVPGPPLPPLRPFPPDCRDTTAVSNWLQYAHTLFMEVLTFGQSATFIDQTIETHVQYRIRNAMPILRAVHQLMAMATAIPGHHRFISPPATQVGEYLPRHIGPRYPFPTPPADPDRAPLMLATEVRTRRVPPIPTPTADAAATLPPHSVYVVGLPQQIDNLSEGLQRMTDGH
jgi:hypothetical protein